MEKLLFRLLHLFRSSPLRYLRKQQRLSCYQFVLQLVLLICFSKAALASSPGDIQAESWLILDGTSGRILEQHNAHDRRDPASLTKLMTAYVVLDAIKRDVLHWDEQIAITAKVTAEVKADEARLNLKAGDRVTVNDLFHGMVVASANDAALVLANRLSNATTDFSTLMNQTALRLGMKDTHFVTPSGITTPKHYTTAQDISTLAFRLTNDFPAYLSFSSQKRFSYRDVVKQNKNRLLRSDPSVDGLKTGHTIAAGWCIVATAKRFVGSSKRSRRVFVVVMGAPSADARISSAKKLLNHGFHRLEDVAALAK